VNLSNFDLQSFGSAQS